MAVYSTLSMVFSASLAPRYCKRRIFQMVPHFAVLDFAYTYVRGFGVPRKYEPFGPAKIRTTRKNGQSENMVLQK